MNNRTDVIIIGAGSAGLSALRQVSKKTDEFLIVDNGPLGTKCARVGCMPSKVLIYAAKDFRRRKFLEREGIYGSEKLEADIPKVLEHVRKLRDEFTGGMVETIKKLAGNKFVEARAEIVSPNKVRVNGDIIETKKIIIATGSSPRILDAWKSFEDKILTSENIFEQKDFPEKVAVVGLGPIGLELGQAISRLGVEVKAFDLKNTIGRISDNKINEAALEIFRKEFEIYVGENVEIKSSKGKLFLIHKDIETEVDAVLASLGVVPNIEGLGLENLGVKLNEKGLPEYDGRTCQVGQLPVFIAGDVNGCRPILHEGLDEGFIAGKNSVSDTISCYCRRVSMSIVFTEPQIISVGKSYKQLVDNGEEFVTGTVDFSKQARAKLELRNEGLGHIYVDNQSCRILGAEFAADDGEHFAHLLSLGIQNDLTVFDMLEMPFYHPTTEEGIRSALRDAAEKLKDRHKPSELSVCESCPEHPVC